MLHTRTRLVVLMPLCITVFAALAAAQIQNPITAAKDAYKRARQQQQAQQQQARGQQTQGQQTPAEPPQVQPAEGSPPLGPVPQVAAEP
jgi:hypothetical protein